MFSKTYEKYVFIDFGLSKLFKEPMGYKYHLTFRGTPNYCSRDMALAFDSDKTVMVDPYYNDINCFKETFQSQCLNNK